MILPPTSMNVESSDVVCPLMAIKWIGRTLQWCWTNRIFPGYPKFSSRFLRMTSKIKGKWWEKSGWDLRRHPQAWIPFHSCQMVSNWYWLRNFLERMLAHYCYKVWAHQNQRLGERIHDHIDENPNPYDPKNSRILKARDTFRVITFTILIF